jgi:hypothetical protein
MKYDPWFLIEIAESTGAQEFDKKYFHENVTLNAKDGWKCVIFYDGDMLDYIDSFITPDGEIINFWEWDECIEKSILMGWSGVGDIERLKVDAAAEYFKNA